MSLIFLAADFPPARGGIQTVAHELPLALQAAGEEVGVVTGCQPGAQEFDDACPYPVVRVPVGNKGQMATNLALGALELTEGFSERPRACVASKWFPEGLAATWALRPFPPPFVLMAYGREFRLNGGNPAKWALQRFILSQVNLAFVCSTWTAGQLARSRVRKQRIHVLHLGARGERFATPGDTAALRARRGLDDAPVLLTTGRLIPRKGHADVINLLPTLMERVGPVSYVIVGDGPRREALQDLAKALEVAGRVHFAGEVPEDELPAWYQLCDVFVMPTQDLRGDPGEGFGLVYLEANAAGRPVVGTAACGVPDAVADGVSGLLVPPQDLPALLEALCRLLGDADLRARLGEAGRRRVLEEFTWERTAAEFLAGLELLIPPRR
jgi:phosphatidylinositol alpha-1,6-mannosyltransferase